jgi:hypothetical protein
MPQGGAMGLSAKYQLSQIQIDAIRGGRSALCVFGEIEYVDIFRRRRMTKINFRTVGQGDYDAGRFGPSARGNDVDGISASLG